MSKELAVSNDAVALIDMTLPQLAEAYNGLDRLEHEYENLSGICATLKGLVLLEAKPKVKGHFKEWVIEKFPKSYRTAARYMRLAEAFAKSDSTVTFQTLTRDLSSSIAALRKFQLDLHHPIVAKVAEWVAGRGSYQLILDLGAAAGSYDRATAGKGKTGVTSESERDQAEKLLLPPLDQFVKRWRRDGLWIHLPRAILSQIDGDLMDIRNQIKKTLKK